MPTFFNLDTHQHETIHHNDLPVNYQQYQIPSPSQSDDMSSESSRDTGFACSNNSPASVYSDGGGAIEPPINVIINLQHIDIQQNQPHLVITEQPVNKFRFRYKSEMHGTHGSLTGISTSKANKTFPSVVLNNVTGEAIIRCSLYQTNAENKCLHSHSLVVRRDADDCRDPHDVVVSPQRGYRALFQGMGIIHTAKRFIIDELYGKLQERNTFLTGREPTELENTKLCRQAEKEAKSMNLNQVCLCFEAYQKINGQYVAICEPVLSNAINNMKSALTGELKITRLSTLISDAAGDSDLFIFVEKVGKKNIKVRFFEEDINGEVVWEDWGRFTEADVHHQYAIALRTPPYSNLDIEKPVDVKIQLYRPNDECESAPVDFRYKPRAVLNSRKRARMCSSTYSSGELPAVIMEQMNQTMPTTTAEQQQLHHFPTAFSNKMDTISMEFNKSGLLADLTKMDMENFLDIIKVNSGELLEYFNSTDVAEPFELPTIGGGKVVTDAGAKGDAKGLKQRLQMLPEVIERIAKQRPKNVVQHFIRRLVETENAKGRNILSIMINEDGCDEGVKKMLNLIRSHDLADDLIDLSNDSQETALHMACMCDKPDIVEAILKLGANPNASNSDGNTALHIAVLENFERCVGKLLENRRKKYNIDLINDNGLTALHLAARNANERIARRLIDAGASVKVAESLKGNNVLHIAVEQSAVQLVKYLLTETDVNPMHQNMADQTAIQLVKSHCTPILQMLQAVTNTGPQLKVSNVEENVQMEPAIVKTEKYDTSFESHLTQSVANYTNKLDEMCLEDLCTIFNESSRWRQLAEAMNLKDFTSVWESSKNPSMMLFKFSEVQGTKLHNLVTVFQKIDATDAISVIDEMIARRIDEEI